MGFPSAKVVFVFCFFTSTIAQQPCVRETTTDCPNKHNENSALGYFCNGVNRSCLTYLTFSSIPPYNNITTIFNLLAANPSEISKINSVSESATLDTNKLVIVLVKCSCSGEYHQSNASNVIGQDDIYLSIANDTFQGVTTCQALGNQRGNPPSSISERFRVDNGLLLKANRLSELDDTIYPFTTLLVPLQNVPSSQITIEPPPSLPPPSAPPATFFSNKSTKKTWLYALLGAVGGSAFLFVLGTITFCRVLHKSERKNDHPVPVPKRSEEREKIEKESYDILESVFDIAPSFKVYSFEELKMATNDFSPSCWFRGSVYCRTFNGDLAAIKKMDGDISKEINLLQKINHSNVIRLSGVCFNEGHWYLVYEYASNGPLSDWILSDNNDGKSFTWTQRIQIALDVAKGLAYLHSFTKPSYVHKDIKSSSILLDSDFRAKITNFGLAKSTQVQEGQFSLTEHIVGSVGYLAPEYLEIGLVSTKLDVYAFGVLLLEMLTGKDVSVLYNEENRHLTDTLNSVVNDDDDGQESLRHFMDPSMGERYPAELANLLIRIVDSCLKKNPQVRPPMDEIAQFLSRTLSSSLI